MSVVYALVARQQNVLCEFTEKNTGGNFHTVTHEVLKHLAQQDTPTDTRASSRSVFPYGAYNFFFLHEDGLTFMCMGENKVQATVAFSLLTEIKATFLAQYGEQAHTAIAYGMAPFAATLEALMKKYDNVQTESSLSQVRHKMEKVKTIMIENVNQLMERGEKIDLLVMRTEKLQQDALKYEKATKKLKRVYCWKNFKYMVAGVIAACLLAFILSFMVCGIDFSSCGRRIQTHAEGAVNKAVDDVSDKVDEIGRGAIS